MDVSLDQYIKQNKKTVIGSARRNQRTPTGKVQNKGKNMPMQQASRRQRQGQVMQRGVRMGNTQGQFMRQQRKRVGMNMRQTMSMNTRRRLPNAGMQFQQMQGFNARNARQAMGMVMSPGFKRQTVGVRRQSFGGQRRQQVYAQNMPRTMMRRPQANVAQFNQQRRQVNAAKFNQQRRQVNVPQFNQPRNVRNQNATGNQTNIVKLYISNLDFNVDNNDIKELFSEFGPIARCGVNYAAAGQSVGTAEVHFKNKKSAMAAFKMYNGVTLDGRPMNLQILEELDNSQSPAMTMQNQKRVPMSKRLALPPPAKKAPMMRQTFGIQKRMGKIAMKRQVANRVIKKAKAQVNVGQRRGAKKIKTEPPTQEQLDADLDAFRSTKA